MAKRKLERFTEMATFPNVFQLLNDDLKGKWHSNYFKNNHPIVLELGCGKGEYTVNMAQYFPDKNFIGIDFKGARLWRGAKTALEEGLSNVAFLRIQIENIANFFAENEVDEIWITFPDPQPQISREKKRLTSPRFIKEYGSILKSGGFVHLKTDHDGLYNYSLEVIERLNLKLHTSTHDLYQSELLNEVLAIKTTYEKIYLAEQKRIHYLSFSIDK